MAICLLDVVQTGAVGVRHATDTGGVVNWLKHMASNQKLLAEMVHEL